MSWQNSTPDPKPPAIEEQRETLKLRSLERIANATERIATALEAGLYARRGFDVPDVYLNGIGEFLNELNEERA